MKNNITKKQTIWDEKNLTEPSVKLESNGELEENDTIQPIKKVLNNINEIDTIKKNKINKCNFCNSEFSPDKFHPNQIYCNIKCRDKDRWDGNKKIIKKICKCCNTEFVCTKFSYAHQIYCSVPCQEMHHRNKKEVKMRRAIRHKERLKTEIGYRLAYYLRVRLNKALKGNYKSGSAVRDLGCSVEELKIYLESLFRDGMNWGNHGEWHIDHKKPLDSFDLTDRTQLLEACHYTNLQPLWAKDNLKKGNKLS